MKYLNKINLTNNEAAMELFGINGNMMACTDNDGDGCDANKGDFDNCAWNVQDTCNRPDYISE